METSAKAGHNVKSLFKKIAMSLPGMEKEGAAADAPNTSECVVVDHLCAAHSPTYGETRHRCEG